MAVFTWRDGHVLGPLAAEQMILIAVLVLAFGGPLVVTARRPARARVLAWRVALGERRARAAEVATVAAEARIEAEGRVAEANAAEEAPEVEEAEKADQAKGATDARAAREAAGAAEAPKATPRRRRSATDTHS